MPEKQPSQKVGKRPKQTFLQRGHRWLTNTWKDAQHRSLLEKCKSKLQWDITSHWSDWPSSKSLHTINAGESVEKREPSCNVGGNANWFSHYERQYGDSLKTRDKTTIWLSNPTSRHALRKPKLKKKHVSQCSLKHYVQQWEHGSNLDVHWQING